MPGLPDWSTLPGVTPLNVFGALIVAFVAFLVLKVIRAARSPLYNIPGQPSQNWIVGDFPSMMAEPTGVAVKRLLANYGHTIRTSTGIFTPPGVITSDLGAIGYIQRNPDLFIKPPRQSRALRALAGDGVLMAEFHSHRRQRRILNPAFSPAAIRDMAPVFYAKAEELRERIASVIDEDKKHDASPTPPKPEDIVPGARKLDMGKYLTELAFDVIGISGCGHDFKCQQESNPIVNGFRDALSALMRIDALAIAQHFWPALNVIRTKRNKAVDASLKRTMDVGRVGVLCPALLTRPGTCRPEAPRATRRGGSSRKVYRNRQGPALADRQGQHGPRPPREPASLGRRDYLPSLYLPPCRFGDDIQRFVLGVVATRAEQGLATPPP
jgi:hypothetical protein